MAKNNELNLKPDENKSIIPRMTGDHIDNKVDNHEQVEWLVNTRTRRSTAGNRLRSLLKQQEADDEYELLFAEDEEDTCFHDVEANQSDIQMDSSTDEEDQGPAAVVGEDDFEGEKELQISLKKTRMRGKKNKCRIPKISEKVRIDSEHSSHTPPLGRNKKVERVPWLPTAGDTPVRASSRQTTRQSKQELHVQIMHREIRRLKQLANTEKLVAKEVPPLTQEDRLKEAARVEKSNAKSLSHWERTEREKEVEQRQRLKNLHNRHMEGPLLTFWSGMATYVGGKLQKIGKRRIIAKEKPVAKKLKLALTDENEKSDDSEEVKAIDRKSPKDQVSIEANKNENLIVSANILEDESPPPSPDIKVSLQTVPEVSFKQKSSHFSTQSSFHSLSSCLAPPRGLSFETSPHPFLAPPSFDGSYNHGYHPPTQILQRQQCLPSQNHSNPYKLTSAPPLLPPALVPTITENCLRSSIIFTNFSETAIKSRETQLNILFPYLHVSGASLTKSSSRSKGNSRGGGLWCAITGFPAKYRDPKTGLYYCNMYAYKQIQKLQRSEVWWSDLFGLFVGSRGPSSAARGVPDRF